MEQKKTFVVRKINFEYNDYTFDFIAEGGIEAIYDNYDSAYAAFRLHETAALEHAYPVLNDYPIVFNNDGTWNENVEKKRHSIYVAEPATENEIRYIRRIHSGRFFTISVFDTTPYVYVIETRRSHYPEEQMLDLDGIPMMFPSYEAAFDHAGDLLTSFCLDGTPDQLSDMPALLQELFDNYPFIFEKVEGYENRMKVADWCDNPSNGHVIKILFELLKEQPFTIKKVNIDHPALRVNNKTYVVRKIAYEFNDYSFDFVAEGGIEGHYDTWQSAFQAFGKLERAALDHAQPVLDRYPQAFNSNGTLNESFDPLRRDCIALPNAATSEERWDINRFKSGRFYTISVFDREPYFYIIETNRSHFKDEKVLTFDRVPAIFPSHESATNYLGFCMESFNLYGTPEELSDMPALLQQLFDSYPDIFEIDEAWENKMMVRSWLADQGVNEALKILFGLLREKPFTIRKVKIDHPALWNKE